MIGNRFKIGRKNWKNYKSIIKNIIWRLEERIVINDEKRVGI